MDHPRPLGPETQLHQHIHTLTLHHTLVNFKLIEQVHTR
ncbi:hypothetical protein B6N60_02208 [Richelia sinica FACHB-800]|uniref:Uncharacterized protein n=1 Tax=Richelia sinica FACHB-800 TaxID=1357546 RepID=A0A975Y4T5_9NOST|nr:hypothetical protein B6N60_02208 [Richelia sinica FACHB-800]